jgi:hypothetical protein
MFFINLYEKKDIDGSLAVGEGCTTSSWFDRNMSDEDYLFNLSVNHLQDYFVILGASDLASSIESKNCITYIQVKHENFDIDMLAEKIRTTFIDEFGNKFKFKY